MRESQITPAEAKQRKMVFWISVGVGSLAVILVLFLLRHRIEKFIQSIRKTLDNMYKTRPILVMFIFSAIVTGIQVFCLPMQNFVIACGAYVINSTLKSFIFFVFVTVSASALIFFVTKKLLYNTIHARVGETPVFLRVQQEMADAPIKLSLLARFLMIPNGLKDYIMAIIDSNFWQFIGCAAITHLLFVLEGCMLGIGLRILESPIEKLPWKKKPFQEKAMIVMYGMILVIAIVAMAVVGGKATKILMNPENPVVAPKQVYNILRDSFNQLRLSKRFSTEESPRKERLLGLNRKQSLN